MRKFIVMGLMVVVALAVSAGMILAQDSDDTAAETKAWLGVAIAESDGQVVITRVQAGSPASAADLLIGDIVVSFNGEAVESTRQLSELVQAAAPGATATLELLRNNEPVTVEVTLGSVEIGGPWGRFERRFEIADDPLSFAEHLLHADLEEADGGYLVADVLAIHNPFELEEGDIVTAVNGVNVTELNMQSLAEGMMAAGEPRMSVSVQRGGETVTLEHDMMGGRFGFRFGPGSGMFEEFGRGPFGFFGHRGEMGRPHGFPFGAPNSSQNTAPLPQNSDNA